VNVLSLNGYKEERFFMRRKRRRFTGNSGRRKAAGGRAVYDHCLGRGGSSVRLDAGEESSKKAEGAFLLEPILP